jgi:DNA-directed RNA polymerase specialized sigma24 family protein
MGDGQAPAVGGFATTNWLLVQRGREALAEIYQRYRPAMRAHVRRTTWLAADEADDIVQGFVASQMLERDLLAGADRAKGKFRTYLLTALDRYIAKELRRRRAKKRQPKSGPLKSLRGRHAADAAAAPTTDTFDTAWARAVLDEAVRRMRYRCDATQRADIWQVFEARLLGPIFNGQPAPDYSDLRERLDLKSPNQASNLLTSAKRMYERMLCSVVAEYCASDQEVEEEVRELRRIVASSRA